MTDFKKGDFVGFIFAQPGNDTTHMVVLETGEKMRCWDVWFDFEICIAPERLWHLSERELAGTVGHHKYGSTTVLARLEQVKAERCT